MSKQKIIGKIKVVDAAIEQLNDLLNNRTIEWTS
jgi:hypothetical protein